MSILLYIYVMYCAWRRFLHLIIILLNKNLEIHLKMRREFNLYVELNVKLVLSTHF